MHILDLTPRALTGVCIKDNVDKTFHFEILPLRLSQLWYVNANAISHDTYIYDYTQPISFIDNVSNYIYLFMLALKYIHTQ